MYALKASSPYCKRRVRDDSAVGVTGHCYLDEPLPGVEKVLQGWDGEDREEMVQERKVVLKAAEDKMSIHVREKLGWRRCCEPVEFLAEKQFAWRK